jgi:probable F420-dependent oxidoreductase
MLPVLQTIAEATHLRIGPFVANNDLRHPLVLAQDLATLDHVTGGRVEVGLGAGWKADEYASAGLPFDAPPARLERLMAAATIIREALSTGRVLSSATTAYAAIDLDGVPTSLQRPSPPILIGGGGRRLLSFAAETADIISLNPRSLPSGRLDSRDVLAAAVDRKIEWIRAAAGDRWESLELNVALYEVDPNFHRRSRQPGQRAHGVTEEEFGESPHFLGGDKNELVATLQERRQRWGISYIALRGPQLDAMAPAISALAGT